MFGAVKGTAAGGAGGGFMLIVLRPGIAIGEIGEIGEFGENGEAGTAGLISRAGCACMGAG
jgi:hypothetical protein